MVPVQNLKKYLENECNIDRVVVECYYKNIILLMLFFHNAINWAKQLLQERNYS